MFIWGTFIIILSSSKQLFCVQRVILFRKTRDFLERFYPSIPFNFSFSRTKLFLLLLFIIAGYFVYNLRSQNKNELEILRQSHEKIQLAVSDYLNSLSRIEYSDIKMNEIRVSIENYKKRLADIEERIEGIKSFWFLD